MNIENKTVLVTGSTDGVGRLVARRLADQGARVLIHGRDRTRGEQLLKEIRTAEHGSAAFLPADFSSLAEVRRLADTVRQECDRLDILLNNAGIGSGGSAGIAGGLQSCCDRDVAFHEAEVENDARNTLEHFNHNHPILVGDTRRLLDNDSEEYNTLVHH